MFTRILGLIIGFFIMLLSIFGLVKEHRPDPMDQVEDETVFDVSEKADELFFGNGFSILLPNEMHIAGNEEDGGQTIMGYGEDSGQAFALRSVHAEKALSLSDLEDICQGILEDVAFHAAGDLVYLTGYDAARDTDICVFTDPDTDEIYVFGLTGTSPDTPASQYFQTREKQ